MSASACARRLALLGLVVALAAAPGARAQHDEPITIPDVPGGPGTIRGRVVHSEDPARAEGVEVLLYALPAGGEPGLRRTTSGPDGAFAFENVSNDPQTAYLVGARYQGVPYPGARVGFAEGVTEQGGVEVWIGEATGDPAAVSVREFELRVVPRGSRLAVLELYRLDNAGTRTVYVPRDAQEGAKPAFRTELPAGAEHFRVPLGLVPEGLRQDETSVTYYGPVYPTRWGGPAARDQGLSFEYELPAEPGSEVALRKRLASGAQRVVVLTPADAPAPRLPGAREEQELEIEGRRWRRAVYGPLPAGRELALAFPIPPVRIAPEAVRLEESRIFLELDDAALLVREELRVRVDGDAPVAGRPGEPLLVLHLPEGAADLRFDRALFERGLRPGDEGEAILDGPLPPGESSIEIAYHLPIEEPGAGTRFTRRFDRRLPLLSIFVADTGLRFSSDRLHRRRPVATPDRTYLHLEAFEVEPSETVSLALTPVSAPARLPQPVRYGLVALAAAAALLFLIAPLQGSRAQAAAGEAAGAEPLEDPAVDAARAEREAVYAALRDLEHDHETGKVSDADYAQMRQELRARAAALLQAEADAAAATAGAAPGTLACPACGAATRPGDRFCAHCGAALARDSAREASA
ncbi:MAG TPA: zinc ribbon domain-containing protein [Myxococcota bacterium]